MTRNLLVVFCFVFSSVGFSQQDTDSLFISARADAEKKAYVHAIEKMQKLHSDYPENTDYTLYLARVYFWNQNYTEAGITLQPLLEKDSINQEVLDLKIVLDLASENFESAISNSIMGKEKFPDKRSFYTLQQAIALEKSEKNQEAKTVLNEIGKEDSYYKEASYVKTQILRKQKNTIAVGHLNNSFSNPSFSPWQLSHIEYSRRKEKIAYVGRVNYGYVFGNDALQAEVDVYPKLSKNGYMLLNIGFSGENFVFPEWRITGEYFHTYKNWNASAGVRYLKFTATEVTLFTAHVAYNLNDWQFGYRTFLVSEDKKWYPSHIIHFRKSWERRESFAQIELQQGGMPYFFLANEAFLRITSYRAGINVKYRLTDNFFIQPIVMFEREEYIPDQFRNRYHFQLIVSQRF